MLLQELQPGPHDTGAVAGVAAPGTTYVLPGVLHGTPEDRLNQLHCWQPAVPTTSIDTIVKTANLFISMVSYQEIAGLLRTNQHDNSTPHFVPGK